ncbi:MAG: DNA adenine methylase, partial [Chloroflexota bacterium]|nr:DNA adenine methylase [Chloroflexota bacterium]
AGWGGELNYPRFQTAVSDGGHGNRLIGAIKHLRERLLPVHQRLKTVIIEHLDWAACIDRYDRPKVVMYIDPPYPDNKCNYAHNMRSWAEHQKLAARLDNTQCQWILSSYDKPETRTLYAQHYIIPVQSFSGMNVKKHEGARVLNEEVLITNFVPPGEVIVNRSSDSYQLDLSLNGAS